MKETQDEEEIPISEPFRLFSKPSKPKTPPKTLPNPHLSIQAEGEEKEEESTVSESFQLFAKPRKPKTIPNPEPKLVIEKSIPLNETNINNKTPSTFKELGLSEWIVKTCTELGMRRPTPVQWRCIPQIMAGRDVLGLAQTGSGKTAAFALPLLQRLAADPYGVFAFVVTPTRELAYQLAEQFRALGSAARVRCSVVVGGMDSLTQAKALMERPHVVIATPGRIRALIEVDPEIARIFSKTKFLVLDEADRVLDVGFKDELEVIFKCLPKNRQTLLFSATMTDELQMLLKLSGNKAYFYEEYEGFKTVETLKQQYLFVPKEVKDVYLVHTLSKMEEMNIRSAMIFVSTCSSCHQLGLLLEELNKDIQKEDRKEVVALHSFKSQSRRLAALHNFKSGKAPILLATDVASRGLDIPTVDLVINYDIPRFPRDYIHRVGRTARAGRGGLSISFVTENDIDLVKEIEAVIKKTFEKFECKENEVLSGIKKVYNARRVAFMKMRDDGFEDKVKERKDQKIKTLKEKGLYNKSRKRKRNKRTNES